MTRAQQTKWIVGSIISATLLLTWVMWPEPNLDGMHPYEKCQYSSYYSTRGGTMNECRRIEADNAAKRLMRGY
jgi:hypothetical protein